MMRRPTVVTSLIALGLSLSGQALAQGAPQPAPAPAPAKPAPLKPAPAPARPVPAPTPPAPAAPAPPAAPAAPPPPAAPAPAAPAADSVTPAAAAVAPAEVAPPAAPAPAPMPLEPAAPPSPVDVAPSAPADPEPDLPPAETYSEGGDSWYDSIDFSAFVDGYVGVNYNFPKPQYGRNVLRAHDYANGFALSWVGVNASYAPDPVGATVSLRFGPTAHQIGTGCLAEDKSHCDSGEGLENVKQAFASWKPGGADSMFQLDLGKFDTPFGAEVAESHLNMNYTRSMLYLSQPVFHTGLRATFAVADAFDFKLIAVNGWNNSIDNNVGKSLGAQVNFHVKDAEDAELLGISIGYLGGPEHDDTAILHCPTGQEFVAKTGSCNPVLGSASAGASQGVVDGASANTHGLRHLIDLVAVVNPIERLRLVLNADYGIDHFRSSKNPSDFDSASYYGVLLGARVAIVDEFGVAARGEFFHDTHGFISGYPDQEMNLAGGTLTFDFLPSDYLTIRMDNRLDWASRTIFNKGVRDLVGSQFTTTLGVVAHTD